MLYIVLSGLAGLLLGGIINMLADDLPYTLHIRAPHYPDGTPRPLIAWLGLTAFLFGKRQAPSSLAGQPEESRALTPENNSVTNSRRTYLSWRHPITEIITAGVFVYIAAHYPLSGHVLFWMGNTAILILITVIDLEHRLILFVVIIPGCIFALIGAALVWSEISTKIPFSDYLIGGAVGFFLFLLMYLGGRIFSVVMANARGEELDEVAFGYGDVMLATLSGFMLGWQALIFAVVIAVFAGGAGALLYMGGRLLVRGKYELFTALPYGQYIVFGTFLLMLWREPLVNLLRGI